MPDTPLSHFLSADKLNAYYGKSHILHDVSLSIAPGQSMGLLGRNGMGKSTLIKSCLGLLGRVTGSVRVRGNEVLNKDPEHIARLGIGYVPEGRGIFPSLTVKENLLVSMRPDEQGRQYWTMDRVLDLFPRLRERLSHGGQQLSGGEQQMLSIGRALATSPKLLVLDEVTEGLAPKIREEIWRTIVSVQKSGMACLIVDRNYKTVLAHTDLCLVLEKGRVVWAGSSSSAREQPELLQRYLGV